MIENAQLIGLSRQMALQRQMDVVANNLANINSTGFKAEAILFEEYIMPVAADRTFPRGSQELSYVQDWATMHDLAPGAVTQTGNPLDLALAGEGFFAVQAPEGIRYTRNGAFEINSDGVLVTQNGYPVLTDGGNQIVFAPEEIDIAITPEGAVTSSAGNKGALQVVEFENAQELTRTGDTMFAGGTPLPATATAVVQGALERSNVSGVGEMTEMIRVTRAYSSLADLMNKQDELRRSAIQRLGDTQA
ncbi:flagellar basal-body rod protein FlgF [Pelagibacterium sp. 26DY04]|uniref:flagellar basal-body rod protein FlgF n=1 Tax=unclassified Pelagibacterium TaxID=2623280 RepID=UPI00281620BC|nr:MULTISPECIES: flagellar basal-body rod protein FlgF [unclassified Pelagibacterium]WMT85716.1 flagellar basal-body rod protein FlgF [Pelagibacterium sp. 26DY04]WMT89999.1 flagellar basal-body rod protein FlgF [Pelagibacterium sp. H642]